MMFRVLFWNLHGHALHAHVASLIAAHRVDFIALAEPGGAPDGLLRCSAFRCAAATATCRPRVVGSSCSPACQQARCGGATPGTSPSGD